MENEKVVDSLREAYAYLGEVENNICNFKKQLHILRRVKLDTLADIQAIIDNTNIEKSE